MGKSTISMAIFNCYVSSPEGNPVSLQPDLTFANGSLTRLAQPALHNFGARRCRGAVAAVAIEGTAPGLEAAAMVEKPYGNSQTKKKKKLETWK